MREKNFPRIKQETLFFTKNLFLFTRIQLPSPIFFTPKSFFNFEAIFRPLVKLKILNLEHRFKVTFDTDFPHIFDLTEKYSLHIFKQNGAFQVRGTGFVLQETVFLVLPPNLKSCLRRKFIRLRGKKTKLPNESKRKPNFS